MPKKYIRKKGDPEYTLEDIRRAVEDVLNKKRTYRNASEYYKVPVGVIFHRIKGKRGKIVPIEGKQGAPKTFTSEKENYIAEIIRLRSEAGYPCSKSELLELIGKFVSEQNIKTKFKDNIPGEHWYRNFMARHPELSLKKPEHLQKVRMDARKPFVIYDFFDKLKKVIDECEVSDKPGFIFNADESGFNHDPSRVRGIGQKGKQLVRVSGGSGRDCTTVLACVSADGNYLPPLIVFKGAAVQPRWISPLAMHGTLYATSKNGWMEEPQFHEWFTKGFIKHVDKIRTEQGLPNQKAILLYDGHKSHISVRIIEASKKNNIILIKFPSHLTDKIQPLDRCVFKPIKYAWDKKLVEFGKQQMGQGSGRLTKDKFVEILSSVWQTTMLASNIKSGFEKTGLFPWDPSKIPETEFDVTELQVYKEYKRANTLASGSNIDEITMSPHDVDESGTIDISDNITAMSPDNVNYTAISTHHVDISTEHACVEILPQRSPDINRPEATIVNELELSLQSSNVPSTSSTGSQSIALLTQEPINISQSEVIQHIPPESSIDLCLEGNTELSAEDRSSGLFFVEELVKVVNTSKISTPVKDAIVTHILPKLCKLPRINPEIISPTKNQLSEIFGVKLNKPDHKQVKTSQRGIRLKHEAYGEVLTNDDVLNRIKKIEESRKGSKSMPKKKKQTNKQDATGDAKKKKRKRSISSSSGDDIVQYAESDESVYNPLEDDKENCDITEANYKNLKNGTFIIVKFKGGKRLATTYKYLCVVDNIDFEDEEEDNIRVTSLKCIDESCKNFQMQDNDVSSIKLSDIEGIVSQPKICMKGQRVFYTFEKPLPIFERA